MRFETEAPVDDILVATDAGGFIAVQAKTTASLSRDPASAFGKTVDQFVRYWLACQEGSGSLRWNRLIDPTVDRLVLAVGPRAPADLREELPAALRLASQPGGGALTARQQRAFENFAVCVEFAWTKATAAPYDAAFARVLAEVVTVLVVDGAGPDRSAMLASLDTLVEPPGEAAGLLTALESVCGDLMVRRGGVDPASLRQALLARGARLQLPDDYREDIERLRAHSDAIASALAGYEVIQAAHGSEVTIDRDCQSQIQTASADGPLLIVGEPGAGKSGVLNALARDLRREGADVLQLAVDRYSVETLEGLSRELELRHGLAEVLKAWDGVQPGWLIVDALDATRGGRGEGVFRSLIDQVMRANGRWRVVASIRTFDLRMGQKFRALFKGRPPVDGLQEPGFQNVRHVRVPPWSPAEFDRLLSQAPVLAEALERSSPRLRELAMVPFNTRLIGELVKDGLTAGDFSRIASQAELLQHYWEHRIEGHGAAALACIRRIAEAMVGARALRAPFAAATEADPAILDTLEREGVLISVEGRRWVQFRHHLLFDFAAARVLLDPDALVDGTLRFDKADTRGLVLAPALTFLLREIWDRGPGRLGFWSAAAHLLADANGDPVIRSATGRACAEYPACASDTAVLAERVVSGDERAAQAFVHVSGAFAIRIEDDPVVPLAPWVALAHGVASNVTRVTGTVHFLLHRLVSAVGEGRGRGDLGVASRALLKHLFTLDEPRRQVAAAIELVADTFDTDPAASRALLSRVFEPERLARFSAEEVPALCRKIAPVARSDPDFAVAIYGATYRFEVEDDRQTSMSDSQIMALRSTVRQDYDMARYALAEFFEDFLSMAPAQAVAAIDQAVEAYVAREHAPDINRLDVKIEVEGRNVRLREDRSYVWAHDPDNSYEQDAQVLIRKLLDHLRSADDEVASVVVDELTARASLAVFWSRLFIAAVGRKDALVDRLLPIAMLESFLALPDTRKDSVDLVAEGYPRLVHERRVAFEESITSFDFSRFESSEDARESLERRLFGAIGVERLATERARAIAGVQGDERAVNNRLFTLRTTTGTPEPYHWIEELDRDDPANIALMTAIDVTRKLVATKLPEGGPAPEVLKDGLEALEALAKVIDRSSQHPTLVIDAEGEIARGISHLVEEGVIPPAGDEAGAARLMALLGMVAQSAGPIVRAETEVNFERTASWGAPAPRVDAAETVFDLALARPDLYPALKGLMGDLLADPHPAVRLQAALRLLRLWELDRPAFWARLDCRLAVESNQGVLDYVCSGTLGQVVHADPARVDEHVQALLDRFPGESERQARMRKQLADLVAVLWVSHARAAAHLALGHWINDPATHVPELTRSLGTLRMAFVAGLTTGADGGGEDDRMRRRAQDIAHCMAVAARAGLLAHYKAPLGSGAEEARSLAQLIDAVCRELFFACGAGRDRSDGGRLLDDQAMAVFFAEVAPTLEIVGDCATPHTVYYLLQLLEQLLPAEPARAFNLAANALLGGGRITGYQFEPMGADLLVRLVGVFLADYKELFEDDARRGALIACLEVFMDAGWPAARRLLYRLPELIQ